MYNGRTKTPPAVAKLPKKMQAEYEDILSFLRSVCQLNEGNYLFQLRYRIINVMKYMAEDGHKSIISAKYEDYLNYIQSLGEMGQSTYKFHMIAVKKINQWAYHKGHSGPDNLMKLNLIKTPRLYNRPEPAPFSDNEISQVFENIDRRFPYSPLSVDKVQRGMNTRDQAVRSSLMNIQLKALVWIMLETGCRISEAYSLTVDSVDPINETIGVMGKFNKWREIPYSEFLREKLTPWLAHRKLLTEESNLWLALWGLNMADLTTRARPVAYETFYNWSAYIIAERQVDNTGVTRESKGRWHRFRKTFATRSNELGLDIGVTSKVLGHEDTRVTMRYVGIDKKRIIREAKIIEGDRAAYYKEAISRGDAARDKKRLALKRAESVSSNPEEDGRDIA